MTMKREFHIKFGQAQDHSIDYLLGMLKDARLTTIQSIEKLPDDLMDWQYDRDWNTVGALLSHIIAIEHFFRIEFVEGRPLTTTENDELLPALDMGEHIPKLRLKQPVQSYIDALHASRKMMVEAVKDVSFHDFSRKIDGYDPQEGCNLAWALYHMVEDEIYHRGQISLIKKLYQHSGAADHEHPRIEVG
jgi:uncharacterized damage-inducible protein DinB